MYFKFEKNLVLLPKLASGNVILLILLSFRIRLSNLKRKPHSNYEFLLRIFLTELIIIEKCFYFLNGFLHNAILQIYLK